MFSGWVQPIPACYMYEIFHMCGIEDACGPLWGVKGSLFSSSLPGFETSMNTGGDMGWNCTQLRGVLSWSRWGKHRLLWFQVGVNLSLSLSLSLSFLPLALSLSTNNTFSLSRTHSLFLTELHIFSLSLYLSISLTLSHSFTLISLFPLSLSLTLKGTLSLKFPPIISKI